MANIHTFKAINTTGKFKRRLQKMDIYSIFMYWKSAYVPVPTPQKQSRVKIPMAFLQGLKRQF